jgi:uncharacterized SAM-binding protein YcdF (DUF218 family)
MMTFLSKLLAVPCYPLGLVLLLLAAGIGALFIRRQKTGRILMLGAGIVLYLFSIDPFSYFLVRSFERCYNPSVTYPPAPAIVLLCGGEVPKMPPRLYNEINDAGDRILYAARLLRQDAAPRLIITGGSLQFLRQTDNTQAEAAFRIIADAGIADTSRIILEMKSQNTYENGVFTKRMLDSLKIPPVIILVTSALHMPRSVAVFKKLGCTVYPAPTDYLADRPFRFTLFSLFPNVGALSASTGALHEIYGMIAYKLLGRL